MLEIPLRGTLDLDLAQAVENEARKHLSVLNEASNAVELAARDAETINTLRKKATVATPDLTDLAAYLGGLVSLAAKTGLENTTFPWVNALAHSRTAVQGRGLWFEILNILVNLAALHTHIGRKASKSTAIHAYLVAEGIFNYAEQHVYPLLLDAAPLEISQDALKFLGRFCNVQASDLAARDVQSKSQASVEYEKLLTMYEQLPARNRDWELVMKTRARELQATACAEIARSLHRSRKIEDRQQQKAAILQCIALTKSSELISEVSQMLNEPFNRRAKTCLNDIDDVPFLVPSSANSDPTRMHDAVPFVVPGSSLFHDILPFRLLAAPSLLKTKLEAIIDKQLCTRLYAYNRETLLAIANHHIPAAVEMAHNADQIPSSLAQLLAQIDVRRKSHHKSSLDLVERLYTQCTATLAQCQAAIRPDSGEQVSTDLATLITAIDSAQLLLQKANQTLLANKPLLSMVSLEPETRDRELAEFIGLSPPRVHSGKERSKPVFLTKVEAFYRNMQTHMDERDTRRADAMHRATKYDFNAAIRGLVAAHDDSAPSVGLGDLHTVLERAVASFSEDFAFLEHEHRVVQKHVAVAKDLESQFHSYSRLLTQRDHRMQHVQSLVLAVIVWLDLEYDLTQCLKTLGTARSLITSLVDTPRAQEFAISKNNCIHEPVRAAQEPSFHWKPGMRVKIA